MQIEYTQTVINMERKNNNKEIYLSFMYFTPSNFGTFKSEA